MKALRDIMGERGAGTALAVLLAYLLFVQGIVGAAAQGAMAMPSLDPLHVLCAPSGQAVPEDDGDPTKRTADCPCSLLCRMASLALPAILGSAAGYTPVFGVVASIVPQRSGLLLPSVARGVIAQPRAPPVFS